VSDDIDGTRQEEQIRRLLGPFYDRSKKIIQRIAARKTPESDEEAGVFGAAIFKLANAELANEQRDSDFTDLCDAHIEQQCEIERLKAYTPESDRFWLEVREPGKAPERKGSWPSRLLASMLREAIAARPEAYITVLRLSHDGPQIQDGAEALQMADARSMSVGAKHMKRTREAHTRDGVKAAARDLRDKFADAGLLHGAGGKQ
jgi:hypothetical protein